VAKAIDKKVPTVDPDHAVSVEGGKRSLYGKLTENKLKSLSLEGLLVIRLSINHFIYLALTCGRLKSSEKHCS
jgi:hypothetical protein